MKKITRWDIDWVHEEQSDSGEWVYFNDHAAIVAALQVQKLAGDNAALTELYRKSVTDLDGMCFEMGMMRGEKSMEYPAPETPDTDAALREIRAQAVDDFGIYHNFSDKQLIQAEAKKYAAAIRSGEQP